MRIRRRPLLTQRLWAEVHLLCYMLTTNPHTREELAHASRWWQSMRTAKATAWRASRRCMTSAYSTASTAGMPLRVMSTSCRYPA